MAKRWLDKDVENENGYCLKGIEDHLRSSYVKRLVVMELVMPSALAEVLTKEIVRWSCR